MKVLSIDLEMGHMCTSGDTHSHGLSYTQAVTYCVLTLETEDGKRHMIRMPGNECTNTKTDQTSNE